MLQGSQLSPEGGELLPLLRAPQGCFLSGQSHCCVIQLSLQVWVNNAHVSVVGWTGLPGEGGAGGRDGSECSVGSWLVLHD